MSHVTQDKYMAHPWKRVVDVITHELFHVKQLDPAQHIITIDGEPLPPDLTCGELNGRIVQVHQIDKVLVDLEAKTAEAQAKFLATNAQDDRNFAARAIARKALKDADVALGQAHLLSYYARIDKKNAEATLRAAEATCVASSIETHRTHDTFVTAYDDLNDYKAGQKRKRD
jgi:hypothetical protein